MQWHRFPTSRGERGHALPGVGLLPVRNVRAASPTSNCGGTSLTAVISHTCKNQRQLTKLVLLAFVTLQIKKDLRRENIRGLTREHFEPRLNVYYVAAPEDTAVRHRTHARTAATTIETSCTHHNTTPLGGLRSSCAWANPRTTRASTATKNVLPPSIPYFVHHLRGEHALTSPGGAQA